MLSSFIFKRGFIEVSKGTQRVSTAFRDTWVLWEEFMKITHTVYHERKNSVYSF